MLEQVAEEAGKPWPLLAACRLWASYVNSGGDTRMPAGSSSTSRRGWAGSRLARCSRTSAPRDHGGLPPAVSNRENVFRFQPHCVEELEMAVAIGDFLQTEFGDTRMMLVLALGMSGFQTTLEVAEEVHAAGSPISGTSRSTVGCCG